MTTSNDIIQELIHYSRALSDIDNAITYQQKNATGYGYYGDIYFN